jgi:hypothetical protein
MLLAPLAGAVLVMSITGNFRRISWYARQVATIWQKWLSRRDRRSRFPKSRFTSLLLKRHPLPAARIVHRYTFASKALPMKNRKRETCTSGTVSDEGGNILIYGE